MTAQAAFSPDEWNVVLEGPPTAGLIVITAAHGGAFRETIAMSKAYAEARAEHGESELLDEIVSAKPKVDHTRYHSAEELRDNGLARLRDAMALLEDKATVEERDDYRRFVLTLAGKVAAAHREHGQSVSPAEETGHPADRSGARHGQLVNEAAMLISARWRHPFSPARGEPGAGRFSCDPGMRRNFRLRPRRIRRIRARSRRACARTVITRCSSTTSGRRSRCACTFVPVTPTARTTTLSVCPCAAGAFGRRRPAAARPLGIRRHRVIPRQASSPSPVHGAGRAVLAPARGEPRGPAARGSGHARYAGARSARRGPACAPGRG